MKNIKLQFKEPQKTQSGGLGIVAEHTTIKLLKKKKKKKYKVKF
jgi:hypothetical protein